MQISIATKIFVAFTVVIVLFTAVLMLGIYRTQETYGQIQDVNRTVVPLSLLLSDVQTDLKSFSLVLNEKDPLVLRRTLQVTRLAPSVPDRLRHQMNRAAEIAQTTRFVVLESQSGSSDVRTRLKELHKDIHSFADGSVELTQMVLRDDASDIPALQTELREQARLLDTRLSSIRTDLRTATELRFARTRELEKSSLYALSASSLVALVVAILLLAAVLLTTRRLTSLTDAAKRIGQGDYTRFESRVLAANDEIGMLTREFDNMARSIADRDQELRDQHAKLLVSERLATVGRMTSLITHELRNPLSSINLNSELLMESLVEQGFTEQDEELLPLLETIISEIDRLRDITEEYLVYARLPTPKFEAQNITDLVQGLVDFHSFEWSGLEVEVQVFASAPELEVMIDPGQLRQALLNLLKNAVEASEAGKVVEVFVDKKEDHVAITITDHAGGIPKDVRDNVFEPFFTTKQSGTGLGLAMTQQIIDENHSRLEVAHLQDGTRFTVSIPLRDA